MSQSIIDTFYIGSARVQVKETRGHRPREPFIAPVLTSHLSWNQLDAEELLRLVRPEFGTHRRFVQCRMSPMVLPIDQIRGELDDVVGPGRAVDRKVDRTEV